MPCHAASRQWAHARLRIGPLPFSRTGTARCVGAHVADESEELVNASSVLALLIHSAASLNGTPPKRLAHSAVQVIGMREEPISGALHIA